MEKVLPLQAKSQELKAQPKRCRSIEQNYTPASVTKKPKLTDAEIADLIRDTAVKQHSERVVDVPVNFGALRAQFKVMAEAAYNLWLDPPTDVWAEGLEKNWAEFVSDCCGLLAVEICYCIYNRLRATKIKNFRFNDVGPEAPSHGLELPLGWCRIIEEFGSFATSESATGELNHVWDGKYGDTFGIPPHLALNAMNVFRLERFLVHMRRVGLACRAVDMDSSPSSAWYSLHVESNGKKPMQVFCVSTTLPSENYKLPRDIFLAAAICGQTSSKDQPVKFDLEAPPYIDDRLSGADRGSSPQARNSKDTSCCIVSIARQISYYEVEGYISGLLRKGVGVLKESSAQVGRFDPVPVNIMSRPIVPILVNFQSLQEKLYDLAVRAYLHWVPVVVRVHGTGEEVKKFIKEGCQNLATAVSYMIYNRVRKYHGRWKSQELRGYGSKAPLASSLELPSGFCSVVEEFGDFSPKDTRGNPVFLHQWDRLHPDTFGLNPDKTLNSDTLHGFLHLLRCARVPFRSVDKHRSPSSAWFTLNNCKLRRTMIETFTTLPTGNYNLPRDAFLSISLCGEVPERPDPCIPSISSCIPLIKSVALISETDIFSFAAALLRSGT